MHSEVGGLQTQFHVEYVAVMKLQAPYVLLLGLHFWIKSSFQHCISISPNSSFSEKKCVSQSILKVWVGESSMPPQLSFSFASFFDPTSEMQSWAEALLVHLIPPSHCYELVNVTAVQLRPSGRCTNVCCNFIATKCWVLFYLPTHLVSCIHSWLNMPPQRAKAFHSMRSTGYLRTIRGFHAVCK